MAYLLDADVFIAAKNLHYGLDFCPAFWDWLIVTNTAGPCFAIFEPMYHGNPVDSLPELEPLI